MSRTWKQTIAKVLLVAMIFSLVPAVSLPVSAAGAEYTLNISDLTDSSGVTDSYTAGTSNFFTVGKSCKVTALAEGSEVTIDGQEFTKYWQSGKKFASASVPQYTIQVGPFLNAGSSLKIYWDATNNKSDRNLFLYNSSGTEIAKKTLKGASEVATISDLAAGTYYIATDGNYADVRVFKVVATEGEGSGSGGSDPDPTQDPGSDPSGITGVSITVPQGGLKVAANGTLNLAYTTEGEGDPSSVAWSVKALASTAGDVGSVNATTGVFTAGAKVGLAEVTVKLNGDDNLTDTALVNVTTTYDSTAETQVWEAQNMAVGSAKSQFKYTENGTEKGYSVVYNDYFTVYTSNNAYIEGNKSWDGDSSYSSKVAFNTQDGGSTTACSVAFSTKDKAEVKVWWKTGGSDARQPQIFGTDPAVKAETSADAEVSTLYVDKAGNYTVGSAKSGMRFWKVEVTEGVEKPADATVAESAAAKLKTALGLEADTANTAVSFNSTVAEGTDVSAMDETALKAYVKGLLEAKLDAETKTAVTVAVTSATYSAPATRALVDAGTIAYTATITNKTDEEDVVTVSGTVTLKMDDGSGTKTLASIAIRATKEYTISETPYDALTVTATYDDDSTETVTEGITWTKTTDATEDVVTIGADGKITAKLVGTVKVKATVDSVDSNECTVTVVDAAGTGTHTLVADKMALVAKAKYLTGDYKYDEGGFFTIHVDAKKLAVDGMSRTYADGVAATKRLNTGGTGSYVGFSSPADKGVVVKVWYAPNGGNEIAVSNAVSGTKAEKIKMKSDNTTVDSVIVSYAVPANKTVQVKSGSNSIYISKVEVTEIAKPVTGITVTGPEEATASTVTLSEEAQNVQLAAAVAPIDATWKGVNWTVAPATEGSTGVSVDAAGKVTVAANATVDSYTVTATAQDGSGETGTYVVTVQAAAPTTYTVTSGKLQTDEATNHGYLTVSPATAAEDATVTVTVVPSEGYHLKENTLKYQVGAATPVAITTSTGENTYTFAMPAGNVTVDAEFEQDTTPSHTYVLTMANDKITLVKGKDEAAFVQITAATIDGAALTDANASELALASNDDTKATISIANYPATTNSVMIKAVAVGETTVTATLGDQVVTIPVEVVAGDDYVAPLSWDLNGAAKYYSLPMPFIYKGLQVTGAAGYAWFAGTSNGLQFNGAASRTPAIAVPVPGPCRITVTSAYANTNSTIALGDGEAKTAAVGDLVFDYTGAAGTATLNLVAAAGEYVCIKKIAVTPLYTVTVDSEIPVAQGAVTVDATGPVAAGTKVTVTVTPETGYQLKAGTLKYEVAGSNTPVAITESEGVYSFNMPAGNVTVTAQFEKITYAVSVNVTNASATASVNDGAEGAVPATVEHGSKLVIVLAPNTNYALPDDLDEVSSGTYDKSAGTVTFDSVTGAVTVTGAASKIQHAVTYVAKVVDKDGAVIATPADFDPAPTLPNTANVDQGANTAVPADITTGIPTGYRFLGWFVGDSKKSAGEQIAVNAPVEMQARFRKMVKVTMSLGSSLESDAQSYYTTDDTIDIKLAEAAAADAKYAVTKYKDDITVTKGGNAVEFGYDAATKTISIQSTETAPGDEITITVADYIPVTAFSLQHSGHAIYLGGTNDVGGPSTADTARLTKWQMTPVFTPSDATHKEVTWTSGDSTVATVDNTGVVTAVKRGTAQITANAKDFATDGTCTVTVKTVISSVVISGTGVDATNPAAKTLALTMADTDKTVTAAVTPFDNTLTDPDSLAVTWSLEKVGANESADVLSFNSATRTLTPVGVGSVKLVAASNYDNTVKDEVTVTVGKGSFTMTAAADDTVPAAGGTVKINVSGLPEGEAAKVTVSCTDATGAATKVEGEDAWNLTFGENTDNTVKSYTVTITHANDSANWEPTAASITTTVTQAAAGTKTITTSLSPAGTQNKTVGEDLTVTVTAKVDNADPADGDVTYLWEKLDTSDSTYKAITDSNITGNATASLVFTSLTEDNAGTYRVTVAGATGVTGLDGVSSSSTIVINVSKPALAAIGLDATAAGANVPANAVFTANAGTAVDPDTLVITGEGVVVLVVTSTAGHGDTIYRTNTDPDVATAIFTPGIGSGADVLTVTAKKGSTPGLETTATLMGTTANNVTRVLKITVKTADAPAKLAVGDANGNVVVVHQAAEGGKGSIAIKNDDNSCDDLDYRIEGGALTDPLDFKGNAGAKELDPGTYTIRRKVNIDLQEIPESLQVIIKKAAPAELTANDLTVTPATYNTPGSIAVKGPGGKQYEYKGTGSTTTPASWESLNASGQEVAAGTYLVRVKVDPDLQAEAAGFSVTVGGAPVISVTAPSGNAATVTKTSGEKLELEVTASVTEGKTLSYVWSKTEGSADGFATPGSVAKYEKAAAVVADSGTYTCVVSAEGDQSVTVTFTVTVNKKAAPAELTAGTGAGNVTVTAAQSEGGDGNIKITSPVAETTYEYKPKTTGSWTEITNPATGVDVAPGDYLVRVKVANTTEQNEAAGLEVNVGDFNDTRTDLSGVTVAISGASGTGTDAGKAKTGDVLSVTFTPAGTAADHVDYQWKVDGTNAATTATYTVQAADAGMDITVTVTAKTGDTAYKGTKTSAAVSVKAAEQQPSGTTYIWEPTTPKNTNNFFTVAGTEKNDSKYFSNDALKTYDGNTFSKVYQNKSPLAVSFTTTKGGTLIVVAANAETGSSADKKNIKIDGEDVGIKSVGNWTTADVITKTVYPGEHTIAPGSSVGTSALYYVKFVESDTVLVPPAAVTYTLTGLSKDANAPATVEIGEKLEVTLSVTNAATTILPETITVKMGDTTLTAGTGYTYNSTTGKIEIASVTAAVEITAAAAEKPMSDAEAVAYVKAAVEAVMDDFVASPFATDAAAVKAAVEAAIAGALTHDVAAEVTVTDVVPATTSAAGSFKYSIALSKNSASDTVAADDGVIAQAVEPFVELDYVVTAPSTGTGYAGGTVFDSDATGVEGVTLTLGGGTYTWYEADANSSSTEAAYPAEGGMRGAIKGGTTPALPDGVPANGTAYQFTVTKAGKITVGVMVPGTTQRDVVLITKPASGSATAETLVDDCTKNAVAEFDAEPGNTYYIYANHKDNANTPGGNLGFYGFKFEASAQQPETKYTVTIDSAITGGTVDATPKADVAKNAQVTVTVTPDTGKELDTLYYTVGTGTEQTNIDKTTLKFNMPEGNVTIHATFKDIVVGTQTITVTLAEGVSLTAITAADKATLTASGELTAAVGATVTFKITVAEGYTLGEVTGATKGAGDVYTVSAAAVSVTATKDEPVVDKTALNTAIAAAEDLVKNTTYTTKGDNLPGVKYWDEALKDDYNTAIAAAKDVAEDEDATAEEVADAVTALADATATFKAGKTDGNKTMTDAEAATALAGAITAANTAKEGVTANDAADPSGVASGTKYVPTATMTALTDALKAAEDLKALLDDEDATNDPEAADVTAAIVALQNATTDFNSAIQTGTYVSGGGSRPSSGGGAGTASNVTTETKPDGTKIKTETAKDGTVKQTITNPDGTKAEVTTKPDGETTGTVTVPRGVETAKVKIPVSDKADAGTVAVIINDDGTEEIIRDSVVVDGEMVFELDESAKIKLVNNAKHFVDVPGHWSEPEVDFVSARELFNGVDETHFAPDTAMTRGMMATVLYRLDGEADADKAASFVDVKDGEWYSEAVDWASDAGVINGYTDGTFAPNKAITRQELVVMVWRYAGSPAVDGAANTAKFNDADKVADWAAAAMEWAIANGIINGKGAGMIDPASNATRAEVSAVLARYVKLAAK